MAQSAFTNYAMAGPLRQPSRLRPAPGTTRRGRVRLTGRHNHAGGPRHDQRTCGDPPAHEPRPRRRADSRGSRASCSGCLDRRALPRRPDHHHDRRVSTWGTSKDEGENEAHVRTQVLPTPTATQSSAQPPTGSTDNKSTSPRSISPRSTSPTRPRHPLASGVHAYRGRMSMTSTDCPL
jgi:hypothetical protein